MMKYDAEVLERMALAHFGSASGGKDLDGNWIFGAFPTLANY
jgi:hypothetical protein